MVEGDCDIVEILRLDCEGCVGLILMLKYIYENNWSM